MGSETTNLTLIIPTLNRVETLNNTLMSVLSGSRIPDQIIIVDQSNDEKIRETHEFFR